MGSREKYKILHAVPGSKGKLGDPGGAKPNAQSGFRSLATSEMPKGKGFSRSTHLEIVIP